MKQLSRILIIIVCTIVFLLVPLIIMWLTSLTPPPSWPEVSGSTMREQTWITFAGGYIGAIIGAIGAILIMFRTIKENRQEKIENRQYADYLYVRDHIEDYISTLESSPTRLIISQMFGLCDSDFTIPDLREWDNILDKERYHYYSLQRAIRQSINIISNEDIERVKNSVQDLWNWQESFKEFVNKIIIENNVEEDITKWPTHRAYYTDCIYKSLVDDVKYGLYRWDENNQAMPYSFTKYFGELQYPCPPNYYTLGEEVSETSFIIVYNNAMVEYKEFYNNLIDAISISLDRLLFDVKTNLDLR